MEQNGTPVIHSNLKRLIAFLLLVGCCYTIHAQDFAIIKDKDGFVNVRKEKSNTSPVVGKIYKQDVFSCTPDNTDWWHVLYIHNFETETPDYMEGYVHKNRVLLLNNWINISPKSIYKDSCIFNSNKLLIVVKKQPFRPKKHKLLFIKTTPGQNARSELYKIDGRLFWGTDRGIPKQAIASLKVKSNGETILIPNNAFDDLYEPAFRNLSVCFGPENTIYISMLNSDGAGAYTIIWIIKNNKFYKRYIDNSEA